MVLDLRGFGAYNKEAHHHLGDLIIKEVKRRIRTVVRSEDKLAIKQMNYQIVEGGIVKTNAKEAGKANAVISNFWNRQAPTKPPDKKPTTIKSSSFALRRSKGVPFKRAPIIMPRSVMMPLM